MTFDSLLHHVQPFSLCEAKVFYSMSSETVSTHITIKESHFLRRGNCQEFVKYGRSGCFPDGPSSTWLFLSALPRATCRGRRMGRAAVTPMPRGLGASEPRGLGASEPRGRLHTFCSASAALTRTCGQRPSRPRRATEPSPSRPSACRAVSAGLERESFPEQAGPVVGPLTPPRQHCSR